MIRKARYEDIDDIMKCIDDARIFLKNSGSTQWNGPLGYPNVKIFDEDIKHENCYVYVDDLNQVVAVIVYEYNELEYEKENPNAKWISNTNKYLTIHRIAVRDFARGKGYAKALMLYAEEICKERKLDSIRIDTHPKNNVLKNLVLSIGYTYCGSIIYSRIPVEPERIIFEKIIK